MDAQQRRALILSVIVVGGGMWFLSAVSSILLPFVVALVLAYLLNPTVSYLHSWGVPRPVGSALLVVIAVSLLVAGLMLGIPKLIDQLTSFVQRLPVYLMTLQHFVLPDKMSRSISLQQPLDALLRPLGMLGAKGAELTVQTLQKALSGVAWLINLAMLIVMTPIVAFYLLIDWPTITRKTLDQLPKSWKKPTMTMMQEIDVKLAAYLRGTLGCCVVLGMFYALALSSLGWIASLMSGTYVEPLELGWAIGMMTGLLGFLPVIGASIGVFTMFAVALVQYQLQIWEPYALLVGIFVLGQILEGYVLTPLLVGQRVGLHPLWIIFALLAGGTLGGIIGMLVAIPTAVIVSVVLPRLLSKWRQIVD